MIKPPRRLLRFHRWLGWALALPLLTIAGSGVVLGFYDELRYAAAPYRVENAVADPLPPARLAEAVRRAFPGFHLKTLYLPIAPERTARAQLQGEGAVTVFVHPGTGAILAAREAAQKDWLDVFYDLHHGKMFHLPGKIVASVSGLGVTILWLIGFMLWRRHPARGYPWAGRTSRGKLRSLHRWAGMFLAAPVAVLAVAGALLNFAAPLKQWLDPPPRIGAQQARAELSIPLARIVGSAQGAYPGTPLERIYFPEAQNGLFHLRFGDGGRVYVDPRDGEIVDVNRPLSHWIGWLYPLHSGRLFGIHGPWVIATGGAVLLLLVVSGLMLSLRR